jgi:hypothetical protein
MIELGRKTLVGTEQLHDRALLMVDSPTEISTTIT